MFRQYDSWTSKGFHRFHQRRPRGPERSDRSDRVFDVGPVQGDGLFLNV